MLPHIPRPNPELNYQWTATLAQANYEAMDSEVYTFWPDYSRGLSGAAVDGLVNLYFDHKGATRRSPKYIQGLQSVLLALLQASLWSLDNKGKVCGFLHSTTTITVPVPKRYKDHDYSNVIFGKLLVYLEGLGYVKRHKGFRGQGHSKGLTTLWLPEADKLLNMASVFEENGKPLALVSFSKDRELLVLRDASGSFKGYEDSDETEAMRQRVKDANELRMAHRWQYEVFEADNMYAEGGAVDIPSDYLSCRRIFRDDWLSGGRFYCLAQGLRKLERSTITIDGQATLEVDFKSLHPRLIYNMNGMAAPDDCYASKSRERTLTKDICLRCINCPSQALAAKSIALEWGMPIEKARSHVEGFLSEHESIREQFFGSAWKRLQHWDSLLVDRVLTSATKEGIPILPVHDSFIARTKDILWLMEETQRVYKELTGYEAVLDWE